MDEERPLESRREIENLRRRYQEHRRSVRHLLQTAPDSRIAKTYEDTLTELQRAIDQLDRVDRQPPATAANDFDPNATHSIKPDQKEAVGREHGQDETETSFEEEEFSTRTWDDPVVKDQTARPEKEEHDHGSRSLLSWIVGLIVLTAIIAGIMLAWPDGEPTGGEAEPVAESEIIDQPAAEEAPPPSNLVAEPSAYDYGIIQKGTRSIHRFTLRNHTDQTLAISVERSECRCLWYDYPPEIPPGGAVDLSVTVDGARANAGSLGETVTVNSSNAENAVAEIDLTAEIREQ